MGLARSVVRVLAQDDDLDLVAAGVAQGREHIGRVDGGALAAGGVNAGDQGLAKGAGAKGLGDLTPVGRHGVEQAGQGLRQTRWRRAG